SSIAPDLIPNVSSRPCGARPKRNRDASRPRWPGVQTSRVRRKDGRSQRRSLADNLPANAADMVKAVHGGGAWASVPSASRALPAPAGNAAYPPCPQRVFGGRKIARECGFHVLVKHRQSPLSPVLTAGISLGG